MIQRFIHSIFRRRHFWRSASFSEIAELYASKMLRTLALNIASSFMSIYLYQLGYSVQFLAFFWCSFFLYKTIVALPLAALAARIGPKHGMLVSNLLFIPSMASFALLPEYGAWVLPIIILFQGASSALYVISYNIDFSKVKSVEHAGKEIAYMNIIEKVTTGLSPLLGGLLAFLVGPQVVMIVAGCLFTLAALPLFKTAEQELPNQKLVFRGFPWHLVRPTVASQVGIGFDVFTSGTVWSLFTAIFIIGIADNNEVYIANGILLSVILFAALFASYAYGRLIDKKRGKELLLFSGLANALTHFLRPFINTPVAVAGLNIANEAATTGYAMSYMRGMFDNADLSGKRATYLGVIEALANFGAVIAAGTLGVLTLYFNDQTALQTFFYIAAGVVLLILTARFPLYRK